MAFEMPLRKINLGQKSISFMGPSIWNKLSNELKNLNPATSFTHKKMYGNYFSGHFIYLLSFLKSCKKGKKHVA